MEDNQLAEAEHADQFPILMNLGDGGQAHVYLGMRNHQLYALKIFEPGHRAAQISSREAQILGRLAGNENFIHIVDYRPQAVVKLNGRPEQTKPMLVLQFAEKGDLFENILKQGRLSNQVSRFYIKQILSAIRYLTINDLSHRDLKLENILFDANFKLKIADFGLSRDARGDRYDYTLRSRVGTRGYQPPEMHTGRRHYTGLNTDLFASGVILFLMYAGTLPFLSTQIDDRIYNLIRNRKYDLFWRMHENQRPAGFYSIEFKRLMNSFFCTDVEHRLRLQDIVQNEWMNGPTVSSNQLLAYMQHRANLIAVNNRKIQEIMDIKMSIQMQIAEQQHCCENQSRPPRNPLQQAMEEENNELQILRQGNSYSYSITEEENPTIEFRTRSDPTNEKEETNVNNIVTEEVHSEEKTTVVVIEEELKETETKKKESIDKRKKEEYGRGSTRIDFGVSQKEILLDNYRSINFNCQKLPQYTKTGVVYVNKNPGFVVTYLKAFLAKQLKNKEIFLHDFVSQILPLNYSLQYLSMSHQIMVELEFSIDKDDQTKLLLLGQLHRSEKNQVGIEWCRVAGNSFWLYGVENALNKSLQALV